MRKFIADCKHCDWESPTADLAEVAAVAGVGHMQEHHAAVLSQGDVSYVRVWEFQEMRVSVGAAEVTLNHEPVAHPQPSAEAPKAHHNTESKAHHEAKKGR